ncbi:hypothetical protein SLE2022_025440 [Rubroshorea leprosula]
MDIEQKQAELIDHFVKRASASKGSALGSVIAEATSHPSLFAFSEILVVSTVAELPGTEHSVYVDMLRLFAHGTWSEYKNNAGRVLQLAPDQVLKLKQLTVLTLAETNKVLDAQDPLADKKSELAACQRWVEDKMLKRSKAFEVMGAMTLNNLQTGLPGVFRALTSFSVLFTEVRCLLHVNNENDDSEAAANFGALSAPILLHQNRLFI